MSTLTINNISAKSSINQGFFRANATAPSHSLTRRARLARTIVVASLAIVLVSGFAATSGAGQDKENSSPSYTVVVVGSGQTLWSVASAFSEGDVAAMVQQIREANNLNGFDLQAGQSLRVPTN